MPKGDRLKLKADPEDGTTPIANLLLEAVAMAKISGLQKGAILYLWRRTYGWVEDGKRLKERKIALSEWMHALDSEKSRVSKILSQLEVMGIIKRRMADAWGGYYYSINTNIKTWNSNCLNIAKLSEMITVVNFGTIAQNNTVGENATVVQKNNSRPTENATVVQNATQQLSKTQLPTLYKERLNKYKEIYSLWNTQEIITHKKLTSDLKRAIETALKDYSKEEVCQSIKNYAEILKGDIYYFKYSWTLKDFLRRGLTKFLNLEVAQKNYIKGEETHRGSSNKTKKVGTKYVYADQEVNPTRREGDK